MNEMTLEAVSAMDTSLWRVYYLIVEDLVDSVHWEDVVNDMTDQGVDRKLIHHCSLPLEGIAKILPLFRSFAPVDYKYPHIPTELLVDTNNYLAIEKTMDKSDTAVFWYDLRSLMSMKSRNILIILSTTVFILWWTENRRKRTILLLSTGDFATAMRVICVK